VFYHDEGRRFSGPYVPPGANIDANDVQTVYLAYVRRLSSHFDLELTAGYHRAENRGQGPSTLGRYLTTDRSSRRPVDSADPAGRYMFSMRIRSGVPT